MIYKTQNEKETEALGSSFAKSLDENGISSAYIAMGVGKTVFARGFASYFGISGVKSPTYTVVNEHKGKRNLFHFDLYRITDSYDLVSIGYDDYLLRDGYKIVEWSENAEDEDIPEDAIFVTISRIPDNEEARIIEISD